MPGVKSLARELKRRKVYRVALVYVIVGFAVIEGAQLIFDALELSRAAWQLVVVLTILGFPIALVLAWAIEVTPEGVQRTERAAAEPAVADGVERRSIAVLPFANMSDDPEAEYFSDGMTEEIIKGLTTLVDMRLPRPHLNHDRVTVIPHTSGRRWQLCPVSSG